MVGKRFHDGAVELVLSKEEDLALQEILENYVNKCNEPNNNLFFDEYTKYLRYVSPEEEMGEMYHDHKFSMWLLSRKIDKAKTWLAADMIKDAWDNVSEKKSKKRGKKK